MILTQYQYKIFFDELEKTGALRFPCVLCGGLSWSLSSYVIELPSYAKDGELCGEYQAIPLTCDTCGNTHFISVKALENKRIEKMAAGVGVSLDISERVGNKQSKKGGIL